MRLIALIKGDILKKIMFYFFCFPLYSTITRNTLTINETAINTNYSYTRIMRVADLSVYCLALPSLNKVDTFNTFGTDRYRTYIWCDCNQKHICFRCNTLGLLCVALNTKMSAILGEEKVARFFFFREISPVLFKIWNTHFRYKVG